MEKINAHTYKRMNDKDKIEFWRQQYEKAFQDYLAVMNEAGRYEVALNAIANYETEETEYIVQSFMKVLEIASEVIGDK